MDRVRALTHTPAAMEKNGPGSAANRPSSSPTRDVPLERARRRAYFWVAMLMGTAIVSLGGVELLARIFITLSPPVTIGVGASALTLEQTQAAFEADPELIWRLRENITFPDEDFALRGTVSNAQHLREDDEIPATKAPNELRILFLGDSITFGWRVRQHETFAHRTQEALRERFPTITMTTINAGVPAYSLFQGWRFLVTRGFDFAPDVVVAASFGFNDSHSWLGMSDFQHYEEWQESQPPRWLQWSMLARLLMHDLYGHRAQSEAPSKRPRLRLDEFTDLLGRVRDASREHGAQFLVVVPGHMNNIDGSRPVGTMIPYQRELARFGEKLHLGALSEPALVDGVAILEALAKEHPPEELMLDHAHPTALIHAALSDAIVSAVAPWIETQFAFGRFRTAPQPSDAKPAH